MSKRDRTILTPAITTNLAVVADEPLTYWKQVLPEDSIVYEGKRLTFDRQYHRDCIEAFRKGQPEQTAFQLANPLNSHGHDMDPERQRAIVKDMATLDELPPEVQADVGAKPGLYAKVQFFSKKAARAVRQNPGLGVSARLRENHPDKAGNIVKRAVVHVLGTLDPVITGMGPWRAVDLSIETAGKVLDLSNSEYEGVGMAKDKGKSGTAVLDAPLTAEDIAALTDEELRELLAELESDDSDDEDDDDNDSDTGSDLDDDENSDDDSGDDDSDDEGQADLSNAARRAIDLSNARANEADRKATEALRRAADAEWEKARANYLSKGVPPVLLDLAAPVLNRPEEFIVDLSNEGGSELNVATIIRAMLDEAEGTIDMSNERGHGGAGDDEDEDAELLAAWENSTPLIKR